jgi:hypothetical protein
MPQAIFERQSSNELGQLGGGLRQSRLLASSKELPGITDNVALYLKERASNRAGMKT